MVDASVEAGPLLEVEVGTSLEGLWRVSGMLDTDSALLELSEVLEVEVDEEARFGPTLDVAESDKELIAPLVDSLGAALELEVRSLDAVLETDKTPLGADDEPSLVTDGSLREIPVEDVLTVVGSGGTLDEPLESLLDVLLEVVNELVLELSGSLLYISSLLPAPQYCRLLFMQSLLQSDVAVGTDPVLGLSPQ